MKLFQYKRNSLKTQLTNVFLIVSIVPILITSLVSYFNSSKLVKENTDTLITNNLMQTKSSLEIWMDSYEDLLYQIYTDDDFVKLVEKVNNKEDLAVTVNQLRRSMRAIQDSKKYIKSITILTESGRIVNYDVLTPVTTENSWLNSFSLSQADLYAKVSADNYLHIFPTEHAVSFANKDYYLFHMAHRMIDYKNIEKKCGIVIFSLDEMLLNQVCSAQKEHVDLKEGFSFIVDEKGRIISNYKQDELTKRIVNPKASKEQRKKEYKKYINQLGIYKSNYFEVYVNHDDRLGWDLVNVTNQSRFMEQINAQRQIFVIAFACSLFVLAFVIFSLMRQLTQYINVVVKSMEKTEQGNLNVRVPINKKMPKEVEIIASTFNTTMERLGRSITKEKEAVEKQKNAEITALEAQINPHFLYNTLDTINWMAIEKDEFEISNSISTLAVILRYAIDKSNEIVTVKEEMDWLKKYIYLQQTRLKNKFQCEIHVQPQVLNCPIHKLLLQPFVENAILHGFDGAAGTNILTVSIEKIKNHLMILLKDNGKGMERELADSFNNGTCAIGTDKNHIGMYNAISRIHMYYGEDAKVKIISEIGQGTTIQIKVKIKGDLGYETGDC